MWNDLEFHEHTRLAVGTEGPSGQRMFFLQAGDNTELVTVKIEKQQATALSEFLEKLIDDLAPEEFGDSRPQTTPFLEPDWVAGDISVGVDVANQVLVVSIAELIFPNEDDIADIDTDSARQIKVFITRSQAKSFIEMHSELINKSRPPCRFCGQPLNSDGHVCPRMN